MSKSRLSVVPVVVALTVAVITGAGAGELAATNIEIVVTADRDARETTEVPANISVVTSDQIDEAGYVSLVDAIKDLDGVTFRSSSGNASQAEISMRGFGENSGGRVLVLLNGRRLNSPDMAGLNWLQVPLANVDRIEVVRGPGSVLYGDHAVGGVINIITKAGTPTPETSLSATAGSFSMDSERAAFSDSAGKVSYSLNAERSETDGYRDRSGYRECGAGGNLEYGLGADRGAALSVSYDHNNYELPGYLSKEQMDEDPRQSTNPNDSAEDEVWNADLDLRSSVADLCRFESGLFYGRKDTESRVESWMSFADAGTDSLGATPRLIFDQDLFQRANKFMVGTDYYRDLLHVRQFADATASSETASIDLTRDTLGFYGRDEFNLTPTLILSGGARWDSEKTSADMPPSDTPADDSVWHHVNAFEASAVKVVNDASKVFARYATVYRFPFIDEEVSYVGYSADQFFADLKPEKGQNVELGTELNPMRNLHAELTLFLLNMQDEIAWNNVTMRNDNLDDTRHQGAEFSVGYTIERICALSVAYTYTDTSFTKGEFDGNEVPLVPRHKVTTGADFFLPLDLTAGATVQYVGASYLGGDDANEGPKLGDYAVVGLSARYTPHKWPGFEARVGVDNFFDRTYAEVGYKGGMGTDAYYPADGRAFNAGVSYKF